MISGPGCTVSADHLPGEENKRWPSSRTVLEGGSELQGQQCFTDLALFVMTLRNADVEIFFSSNELSEAYRAFASAEEDSVFE